MHRFALSMVLLCGNLLLSTAATYADELVGPKRLAAPTAGLAAGFYQALNSVTSNQFSAASEQFTELKALAIEQGIENLPAFSLVLLERAETKLQAGEREQASFLLRRAEQLSPRDARVLFSLALFRELNAPKESFAFFIRGLSAAQAQPYVLATFAVNGLLLCLTGFTVALLLLCVFQITRESESMFALVYGWLPVKNRGVTGPPIVLLLLLLPLAGGVLFALGCWSLLLSRANRSLRPLALLCGACLLTWGMAIPVLGSMRVNLLTPQSLALEMLRTHGYSEKVLESIGTTPMPKEDPLVTFTRAQAQQLAKQTDAATAAYTKLLSAPEGAPFVDAIQQNQALLWYDKQEYARARTQMTKNAESAKMTFELAYNLSLVHLAELDTEGHRKYYALAESLDRGRLSLLEGKGTAAPLLATAPMSSFFSYLLRVHAATPESAVVAGAKSELRLSDSLARGSNPPLLAGLGVFFILTAFVGPGIGRAKGASPSGATAKIWTLIPGGYQLVHGDHVLAVVLLGGFLSCVLAITEVPVRLLPLLPLTRTATSFFYWAAAALFIVSLLSALGSRWRHRAEA